MRLNTQYYEKKKSKSTKSKKASQSKTKKTLKIDVNYTDMSKFELDSAQLPLNKLRYGVIESCDLISLVLDNECINISNSWIGLLMLMIQTLMERNPEDFTELLGKFEVTNQFLCVDRIYGKYTFDGHKYTAYKIGNTEYFLESTFETPYIFSAIVGLAQALDIKLDKIAFNIRQKGITDLSANFNLLSETEEIVDMYHVKDKLEKGIHMIALDIKGESTKVHRIDTVLYLFCTWVFNNYGYLTTLSMRRINNTGVSLNEIPKGTNASPIANSDGTVKIFTDNNKEDIVDFITENMKKLGVSKDSIKIKFRSLKDKNSLKEYEVE